MTVRVGTLSFRKRTLAGKIRPALMYLLPKIAVVLVAACLFWTAARGQQPAVESLLEILTVATGERQVIYRSMDRFEAPNWSRDGRLLLVNSRGRLWTISIA